MEKDRFRRVSTVYLHMKSKFVELGNEQSLPIPFSVFVTFLWGLLSCFFPKKA